MENWLRKNRKFLNLLAIERKLGCSRSTLSKVANDENKKLPKKWREPLRILACDMGYGEELERKGAVPYRLFKGDKEIKHALSPEITETPLLSKLDIQSMVDKQKKK